MKLRTLISAAMLFILVSQPVFSWTRVQPKRFGRGGWTFIRIPVTPMPFPIYLPFQRSQLEEQGYFRGNRDSIRERRSFNDRNDRFKPFGKRTLPIRMPKW